MILPTREKNGQGYPSPPVVQFFSRRAFDTLFHFSQMCESSLGMLCGHIGMTRLPMLNSFVQMRNHFVQMRVLPPLSA
jgi:hypothetical protein